MGEFLRHFFLTNLQDIASLRFMQHALLAGVMVGASCSVLSVFIVLKRMAFIGQGISHSAFGGLALALLLFQESAYPGAKVYLVTALFCLGMAMMIGYVGRRHRVSEDTAIGIFFVVSMALGVIFIALRRRYTSEVFSYLFGSILAVSPADVKIIAILSAFVVAVVVAFFKEFYFFTFDEEMAQVTGLPVERLRYGLLALLALTIVVAVKVVGVILISAFLIIPGAAALALTASFRAMMAVAVAIGVFSSLVGLMLSNTLDIPSGATIVLTQFVIFMVAQLARLRRAD